MNSNATSATDEELIDACRAGDAAAWNALIEKYQRLIYAIPFRYGATAADADDIFQAVCLELYEELPRLRRNDALRSWLMTVASRLSLRWKLRQRQRGEQDLDTIAEPLDPQATEPPLESLERGQLVHEALTQLPARCQQMIQRLFFDDPPRSYDEVAAEFGLARGSIGFIRGRCLEKLEKALAALGYR